jgi:hypothetical protein
MMKKLLMALVLALPLAAQEQLGEDLMKAYIEAAKPVAEHQRLAELQGPWKVTSRMWFDPAAMPMTATGRGKGELILGGRFVSLGTSVEGGPAASDALSILGFDRRTNEFSIVSFDTHGTYYVTAAGRYDEAMKAVVMNGTYLQPPGNTEQKYRFVWRTPSPREQLFTVEFEMDTRWVKVAQTEMTK